MDIVNYVARFLLLAGVVFVLQPLSLSAMTACKGQPASVSWSWDANVGVGGCAGTATDLACSFSPLATPGVAGGGSKPVTIPASTPSGAFCTATITCQPGNISKSDTLIYDATKEWNGSACVTAAIPNCTSQIKTWTEGGYSCTGDVGTGSTGDGFSTGQTDTTPTNTGSAVYTCNGTTNTYTYNGGTCAPGACTNGAINPSACTQCPANLYWNGTGCGVCNNGGCTGPGGNPSTPVPPGLNCNNGGVNPPTCTPPSSDACGSQNGTYQSSEPTGTNACSSGSLNSSSPVDTADNWRWSCGSLTCSAIKPGCNVANDTNYSGANPANNYNCANTCANGMTNYPTCTTSGGSPCPATPVSWLGWCGATTPAISRGNSQMVLHDSATYPGYTGQAVYSCSATGILSGPTSESCVSTAPPPPGPASCGSGDGTTVSSQPSGSAACSAGSFGEVDDTATTWKWECQGPAMFGNVSCSANKTAGIPFGAFTSTPNCTIALGASTCLVPISWTSANLSSVYLTDCGGGLYDSRGVGSQTYSSVTVPYSGGEPSTPGCYQIHNGSTLGPILDTVLGSANCVSGTSWDGSKCTDLPTGTLTIVPPSCIIPRDQHTCNVRLDSTAVNVDRMDVWRVSPDPAYLFPDGSRGTVVRGLSTTFRLEGTRAEGWVPSYHPAFNGTLDTKTATASCNTAAGDWWDASERFWDASIADFAFGKCKAPVAVTLTVPNCVILADQSTCVAKPSSMSGGTVGWSYGLENITAIRSTANVFSSPGWTYNPVIGIGTAVELKFGANTINLWATNKGAGTAWFAPILRSTTATASCTAGTNWDGSKCASPLPTASLTVGTTNLSYNGQTTLTWNSTGASASGCVAGGPWLNSPNNAGSGLTDPLTTTTTFTFQCTGPTGTSALVSRTVTVCPSATPIWRGGACHPLPTVGPVGLTGQYTPAGSLNFTCNDSDRYEVWKNLRTTGTLIQPSTPYVGIPVSVPVTALTGAGNYNIYCSALDSLGLRVYSAPSAKYYSPTTPTPPVLSINASPKTIQKGTESAITWSIKYPIAACKVNAAPVCSGACVTLGGRDVAKIESASVINTKLTSLTEKTDTNDRFGSRKISDAFWKPINPLEDDKIATGKKTFRFTNTTDFILDCGVTTPIKKVRVNVTSSNEG